jgi:hypothetical protein
MAVGIALPLWLIVAALAYIAYRKGLIGRG